MLATYVHSDHLPNYVMALEGIWKNPLIYMATCSYNIIIIM